MQTLYGKYGASSGTGELRLRQLVADFRTSEAAKCGCGVSNLAWICQASRISVCGTYAWGQSGPKSNERLSLSTTLSSGPCVASFVLLFLYNSVENFLVLRALEAIEDSATGAAHLVQLWFSVCWTHAVLHSMHPKRPYSADDVTKILSSCKVADWGMDSSHNSADGHSKRRRTRQEKRCRRGRLEHGR